MTHGTPPGPKDLVGSHVRVKWSNGTWYQGTVVKATNSKHGLHEVKYDLDESGDNSEPVYENLGGIHRTKVDLATWERLDDNNNNKPTNQHNKI